MRLTYDLIQTMRLDGWDKLLPVYSADEISVMETAVASFQSMANKQMGGKASFHPELIGEIQRPLMAEALQKYAGRDWQYTSKKELPADWKLRVSTYLKAWAGGLNPNCLIEMAEMLAMAGNKAEAKEALEVVFSFPTYASTFYGGAPDCEDMAASIVNSARESLEKLQDLPKIPQMETSKQNTDIVFNGYPSGGAEVTPFNPKAASWLRENAKAGRWFLNGQVMQLPMSEVAGILAKAREAGFVIKTNRI